MLINNQNGRTKLEALVEEQELQLRKSVQYTEGSQRPLLGNVYNSNAKVTTQNCSSFEHINKPSVLYLTFTLVTLKQRVRDRNILDLEHSVQP